MKSEKKIAKGKVAVIKKNGQIVFVKKAEKGLRIEGDSSLFEITEKAEKDLTKEEKLKVK